MRQPPVWAASGKGGAHDATRDEARRRAVRRHKANDALFSEASFPILREDGYFRLELVDEHGRRAYTRAYDARELALS